MKGSEPTPSVRSTADDRWTIRPKNLDSAPDQAQSPVWKAADIVDSTFIHDRQLGAVAADQVEGRSKRWLALGLAGAVYVMGVAGLWSIYQTFEGGGTSPLTPARGTETNAPAGEPADLRDAELIEAAPSTSG